MDDRLDVQFVFFGECEVALIVGGNAHDRTIAIAHQHIVADPDRHLLLGEWMRHHESGGHALFLAGGHVGFSDAPGLALFDKCCKRWVACGRHSGNRMLRRHGHERDTHDGVGTGGEDKHLAVVDQRAVRVLDLVRERKAHTDGFSNPVFLHGLDPLGPSKPGEVTEQLFCIRGDSQVVHGNFTLFHHGTAAPATAIDHLFIGEHGLVDGVPVDGSGFEVGDALFAHL